MIKVNLVPAEILAKASQRQLLRQSWAAGALLAALLALISAGHLFGKFRLAHELSYNESELKRLSKIVEQVEALEKATAAVRARLNVIEELLRGRSFYPIFMSDFARSVPPGVRVSDLRTTSQPGGTLRLAISAVANSQEDIAVWVRGLENDARFGGVELGAVNASGRQFTFTIAAVYTQKL